MKKYLLILILILCGCGNKNIEMVFENSHNMKISINFPESGIKKLDNLVSDYVDTIYQGFKNEYENVYALEQVSELNVDYKYSVINERYINIILYTFINSSKLAHPINEVKTFVYDKQKNKLITIYDLINNSQINILLKNLKMNIVRKYKECLLLENISSKITPDEDYMFNITKDSIVFYFNPYTITTGSCGIIDVEVSLNKLDTSFKSKETIKKYPPITKTISKNLDLNKKTVAITFDDGPSKYTNQILELLKENNANATFFVLGNKVKDYSDTIRKSISLGNEIGNHSYNHKWLTSLSLDELNLQISKTNALIKEISGYECNLFRPTYGSVNKKIRENVDMNIVLWSVDSNDWKIKNSKTIASKVLSKVDDGDIILFHDTYERTYKALQIIVPTLISEGYQIVTVSELEKIKLERNI
ncbi:putative uncharacterized protein [Acholeplasma sp. CAG:878]|nr:putative uncharacterized protein [Acholeplasma sp. CAG:878]